MAIVDVALSGFDGGFWPVETAGRVVSGFHFAHELYPLAWAVLPEVFNLTDEVFGCFWVGTDEVADLHDCQVLGDATNGGLDPKSVQLPEEGFSVTPGGIEDDNSACAH